MSDRSKMSDRNKMSDCNKMSDRTMSSVVEVELSRVRVGSSSLPSVERNSERRNRKAHSGGLAGVDHSVLAMEAARRMRRVKHKEKYGRVVCHHLTQMLTGQSTVVARPLQTPIQAHGYRASRADHGRQALEASARQILLGL